MRYAFLALVSAVLVFVACTVKLGDDKTYSCSADSECGGDSFICVLPSGGGLGHCCKPSATDDCKIHPPDGGNNCPGVNLVTDHDNCGTCGHKCAANQICQLGTCNFASESSCSDGIDNDMNGKTDCADSACNGRSCGTGCTCLNLMKTESDCGNGLDDDGDGQTDCADTDCNMHACDAGCACASGAKHETNCYDTIDNDGDGQTDCNDTDCGGQACQAPPSTFTCSNSGACNCNGGSPTPEDGGAACRDGIDNDCNGKTDCADPKCDLAQCALDGGQGCQCVNAMPTETNCRDLVDNDNDGLVDCADFMDCPAPVNCTVMLDGGGTRSGNCAADHTCH